LLPYQRLGEPSPIHEQGGGSFVACLRPMGFAGHPYWPPVVLWFRNAAYVVFLLAQFGFSFREYGKRGSAKCSLCCRNRQRAAEDKLLGYNSGVPKPPVIFFISDWASALPCSIACCTPLKTASSKNSTSF